MFQRDPITFNRLKALSMRKRMDVVRSPDVGPGLFTALTPTDLASLFPDYYKKILPDVGGFRRAISAQSAKESAVAAGKLEERLAAVESKSASIMVPVSQRQRQAAAPGISQLSPEQMAAFKKIQQGAVGVNSSDAKFFNSLSTSQLASIGITKSKDNTGADVYQYSAPEVGREEAVSRLKIETDIGTRSGGSRSWRNRNPGNIEFSDFAKSQGAIGSDGRFAIFRTEQDGINAQRQLLFYGKNYKDLTLAQAINRWAPSTENNVPAYISAMGANPNTKMSDFNREQQDILLSNMRRHEGWKPGTSTGKEGEGATFTEEQVTSTQEKLKREKEEARLGQFAALVTNNMSDTAGINPTPGGDSVTGGATSKVSAVQYMMNIVGKSEHDPEQRELIRKFLETGGHGVNPEQTAWCAATVGSALRQAGIKDIPAAQGGNVATSYGNWGRGVNMSQESVRAGDVGVFMNHRSTGESLAPGQVGGHVGMLTGNSRMRSDGKLEVEMVEGNTGDRGSVKWHVVGERGLQIRRARPGVEYEEQTLTQVADQTKVEVKPEQQRAGEPPEAPPVAPPEPTADVAKKTELNPQAVRDIQTMTPPAAPPPTAPNRFRLNQSELIASIKNTDEFKNTFGSSFATDSMILDGFFADSRVKAAGVSYNAQSGVMSFKDPNDPKLKEALAGLDTKRFMTPIEEKKKEAPKPKQQAEPPKARAGEPPEAPPAPPPEPAPKQVQGYSEGGSFDMKGDTLSLYKVDKQDDMVAINPQTQEPIATLKSGEGITSGDSRVDVTPQSKTTDARPEPSPLNTMAQKVNNLENTMQSAIELANRPMTKIESMTPDTQTNHSNLIADTNRMIANQQKFSPSYDRAMNRIANMSEPPGYNQHYSYGNK